MGHDPTDRLRAMDLAQHYGKELYVGVFYRNPDPPPTYESQARARHEQMRPAALPKERILDIFMPQWAEACQPAETSASQGRLPPPDHWSIGETQWWRQASVPAERVRTHSQRHTC